MLCINLKTRELRLSNQKFDIIIVGAGTAGLEIAKNASLANLRTCLIDQGSSEGKNLYNEGAIFKSILVFLGGSMSVAAAFRFQIQQLFDDKND